MSGLATVEGGHFVRSYPRSVSREQPGSNPPDSRFGVNVVRWFKVSIPKKRKSATANVQEWLTEISYGKRLRESWSIALKDAQARFRSFLVSSTSASWKRIHIKSPTKDIVSFGTGTATAASGSFKSTATSSPPRNADVGIRSTAPQRSKSQSKGKAKSRRQLLVIPEVSDVIVHRRVSKDGPGEVHRAVLDVTLGDDDVESLRLSQLNAWRAVLSTPEMRKEYDSAVQDGQILEMFDAETRISKLDFALGWPAKWVAMVDTVTNSYVNPVM